MNPYAQYMETAVLTATPMELVRMLYRCGIESVSDARLCLQNGDVAGRAKPVTKVLDVLTELLLSLDYSSGGPLARNLAELYNYMQNRIIDAHCSQNDAAFAEVSGLLKTLLESWEQIESLRETRATTAVEPETEMVSRYSYAG